MKKDMIAEVRIKYIMSSTSPFMINKALGILKAPYNSEDLELCSGVYFYTCNMAIEMTAKEWYLYAIQLSVEIEQLQRYLDVEAEILTSIIKKSA